MFYESIVHGGLNMVVVSFARESRLQNGNMMEGPGSTKRMFKLVMFRDS